MAQETPLDGTRSRTPTDEEAVKRTESYIRTAHSHLAGQLSREQLLEVAAAIAPTTRPDEGTP